MARLDRLYAKYNKKYFGNRLPVATLQIAPIKPFGQYLYKTKGQPEHLIQIADWLYSVRGAAVLVPFTLLHEMAHLHLRVEKPAHSEKAIVGHGRLFHKEMKRLANLGAFVGLW